MRKYAVFCLILLCSMALSCKKPNNNQTTVTHPVASFTDSVNVYSFYTVSFKSNSTGNPLTLTWNFGDGSNTDTGKVISHSYSNPGTYHVILTATNSGGSDTIGTNIVFILQEQVMDIHTRFGDMYMWLYDETPAYKANFIKNVTTHLYDSTTFHRIVPNFVIQGGDSLSKGTDQSRAGTGGPDNLPLDIAPGITHVYGAVGAASLAKKGPGNNWQFYIVTNKAGDHSLDGDYSVFGFIMKGMGVANTIQGQPANTAGLPNTPIRMSVNILHQTKAQILAQYGYTVK
jgi:cyclophilin family peptidyl-prolyl cis-trans isomerase